MNRFAGYALYFMVILALLFSQEEGEPIDWFHGIASTLGYITATICFLFCSSAKIFLSICVGVIILTFFFSLPSSFAIGFMFWSLFIGAAILFVKDNAFTVSDKYDAVRGEILQGIQKSTESRVVVLAYIEFEDGIFKYNNWNNEEKAVDRQYSKGWKNVWWYKTGYAPIDTDKEILKDTYILMGKIDESYSELWAHSYFLVEPTQSRGRTKAILKSENTLSNKDKIIAVSLGQYENAPLKL